MARIKNKYPEFVSQGVEVVAIGPNDMGSFQRYWADKNIPFIGLPDPQHIVSGRYSQEINIFKLGRIPLNCVVDKNGRIRYIHYGSNAIDIPDNKVFFKVIDEINKSSNHVVPHTFE
ncbi:MAG: redoxin domain-containing protein [Anaerolineales bacterium]|nr:redoxin domain-containing protein [Anaerolineales bacterium]